MGAVEIFLMIHELTRSRSWDVLYELLAVDHRQYANGVLLAETRDATRELDMLTLSMFAEYERVVHDLFGTSDQAACRSTLVGTTFDGRQVEIPFASVIHVHAGRVTESWTYGDPAGFWGPTDGSRRTS